MKGVEQQQKVQQKGELGSLKVTPPPKEGKRERFLLAGLRPGVERKKLLQGWRNTEESFLRAGCFLMGLTPTGTISFAPFQEIKLCLAGVISH